MKATVILTYVGIFGLDENGNIIVKKLFGRDFKIAAEKFLNSEKEIFEVESFLKGKGYEIAKLPEVEEKFLNNLREFCLKEKIFENIVDFHNFISNVSIEVSKAKIKENTRKDKLIADVSNLIDELEKIINVLIERLKEIYSLHFPELENLIKDNLKYVEHVKNYVKRENFKNTEFEKTALDSVGIELNEKDYEKIKELANFIYNLNLFKEEMENYLGNLVKEIAPNLYDVAGYKVASKLIAKAGSLEKLAKAASTTIQLLGAEKALFRFLKTKGKAKAPKHGIIFIHPLVQQAPQNLRGKIARILASKINVAAKIDYFSKEYKGKELLEDLKKRIKEVYNENH